MDDREIIEKYYKLRSCRAVAEEIGCSAETVRRALIKGNANRTGWKVPPKPEPSRKHTPLTTEEKAKIVEAYKRINNQEQTAEEVGRNVNTVRKVLKEAGLARGIGGNQDRQRKISDTELVEACKTMTLNEIAAMYNMHPYSLPRRFKRLGIEPVGYASDDNTRAMIEYWKEHPDENKVARRIFGDCWHYIESQKQLFEELQPGFEYLETRKTPTNKRVRMKCKGCGHIVERNVSTVREKKIRCEDCEKRRKLTESYKKLTCIFLAIKDAKTPRVCPTCGKTFCSPYQWQIYCSEKCRYKAKPKNSSIRKRCRRYGVYYDPAVTRKKVFERDGYICQICGKPTDPTDTSWGNFGAMAPTIDHIVALKNGGSHTWDNVQCAHAICNSIKRDLWVDELKEILDCLA